MINQVLTEEITFSGLGTNAKGDKKRVMVKT